MVVGKNIRFVGFVQTQPSLLDNQIQRWVVPLFFVFFHSTVECLLKKTFDCWVHNFSKKNFQSNGWVPALKCTRMGVIECLLACACLVHAKFWTKVYQLQAPDLDIFFSKTGFIISQHWSRLKNDIFEDLFLPVIYQVKN